MRVHGFCPFQPVQTELPDQLYFSNCIDSEDLWNNKRIVLSISPREGQARKKKTQVQGSTAGVSSSHTHKLGLNIECQCHCSHCMPSMAVGKLKLEGHNRRKYPQICFFDMST